MKQLHCNPAIAATHPTILSSALASLRWQQVGWFACLAVALAAGTAPRSYAAAADHGAAADHAPTAPVAGKAPAKASASAASAADPQEPVIDLKKAIKANMIDKKSMTLLITEKPESKPAAAKTTDHAAPAPAHVIKATAHSPAAARKPTAPAVNPRASRDDIKAKAAAMTGHDVPTGADAHGADAHGGDVHWSYEGETGPQNWGKLKPEFSACAIGKRQTPINIEDSATLHGPAEALQFNYNPSSGSVVNNGHTIQVDLQGDNSMTVRGVNYRLVQFHFHTPSEEQVNYRASAMVAHLVHKSADGQLAVVAVLMDAGQSNPVINTVWTYMPLDVNDRVRLPLESIDLNDFLPKDQRYYQFMGSLTTPPCTENVLWNVIKMPTQVSKEQIHLFQQLYPANARPVQPVNNRPIRNAQ
jgi:carbonic anhydrase